MQSGTRRLIVMSFQVPHVTITPGEASATFIANIAIIFASINMLIESNFSSKTLHVG